jgi:ferric-dicitrate binding protein FerR (iron transport regulator)
MFARMERIYMLERAAGVRAAKEARGLPTGRPGKLNALRRCRAARRLPHCRGRRREPGGLSDAQSGVHLGLSLALAASADRWRAGGGDRAQAPDAVRRLPLPDGVGQVGHPG